MGHKVNPVIFRLGISNQWQTNLKEPKNWITNYLIYQLVSHQFLKYTLPYFNRKRLRNRRNSNGLVVMKGEKQLKENKFLKRSMLLSHLLVGSLNNNLKISCYFLDYKLKSNHRIFRRRGEKKKIKTTNLIFSNLVLTKMKAPSIYKDVYYYYYNKGKLNWRSRSILDKFLPNPEFLNLRLSSVIRKTGKINFYKLNKIWLRLSAKANKLNKNQKIFFYQVWSRLIFGLLPLIKVDCQYVNRFLLVLIVINLLNFQTRLRTSMFFFDLFRTRYFLFKSVSKSLNQNLKSMLLTNSKLTVSYHAIREKKISSSLLTNLILIKLGQYFRINSIIYPLAKWMRRHRNVLGYRIIVSGRLTRRERASHIIKTGRKMPLSSLRHKIDYNQDIKIMKFGMVGIKIYLYLRKKTRNSYYYFKFILA